MTPYVHNTDHNTTHSCHSPTYNTQRGTTPGHQQAVEGTVPEPLAVSVHTFLPFTHLQYTTRNHTWAPAGRGGNRARASGCKRACTQSCHSPTYNLQHTTRNHTWAPAGRGGYRARASGWECAKWPSGSKIASDARCTKSVDDTRHVLRPWALASARAAWV